MISHGKRFRNILATFYQVNFEIYVFGHSDHIIIGSWITIELCAPVFLIKKLIKNNLELDSIF